MADKVTFSSVQLLVDEGIPSKSFLEEAFEEGSSHFDDGKFYHSIETKVLSDRFYWFYSNHGKAEPRREKVMNVESHSEEDNPRNSKQAELVHQIFAVYDKKTDMLYISNFNKKGFFKEYFEQFTDKEVLIKNCYKNIDDFIDIISSIGSIKFTGIQNLFSTKGDLMEPLHNIFGYGEPEEFSIEATYNTSLKDALVRRIKELAGKQRAGELQGLVCIGKDDRGIDKVFNSNSFVNKVTLHIDKNEELIFNPDQV